jgi:hypothetical protein
MEESTGNNQMHSEDIRNTNPKSIDIKGKDDEYSN